MKIYVGTDIESVKRFKNLAETEKALKNIFFKNEYNYAKNKSSFEQSLTGIWCAKEAVVKSFSPIKTLNVKDVEIICKKNTAPKVLIKKNKKPELKFEITISISHNKDYATAVAVLTILN
jgi:phosphopantetheine--protein transferase-like protein